MYYETRGGEVWWVWVIVCNVCNHDTVAGTTYKHARNRAQMFDAQYHREK